MDQPKNKGGRPKKADEDKLVQRSIRFPSSLWDKIDLYGLPWLRKVVERAKPPKE